MQKYYTFQTCADGMHMPKDFRDSLYFESRFPECSHIRPEATRKKFIVPIGEGELDLNCAYNFIWTIGGWKFFRKDLFSVLEPYLVHEFDFGQIKYQDQIITEGFVLWNKTEPINVRGGMHSEFYRCKYCGQQFYTGGHIYSTNSRQRYVLQRDIEDTIIRPANYEGLLINEEVYQVLTSHPDWKKIKYKTELKEIKIEEVPKDGFPLDLADTKPEDERLPRFMLPREVRKRLSTLDPLQ